MANTKSALSAAHTPDARRKAVGSFKKVLALKKQLGMKANERLDPAMLKQLRQGVPLSKLAAVFTTAKSDNVESIPVDSLISGAKAKPGRKQTRNKRMDSSARPIDYSVLAKVVVEVAIELSGVKKL